MKHHLRLAMVLLALCAAACALVARHRERTSERESESAGEFERVAIRLLARDAIATEVLQGRLSLQEGAAVDDWLNQQSPVLTREARHRFYFTTPDFPPVPGLSDEGYLCHSVLRHACSLESATPERIAELKSEFRTTCQLPHRFSLPKVNEPDCVELWARSREAWSSCKLPWNPRQPVVSAHGLRFEVRTN